MKIKGIDVYCMSCIPILNLAYEGVDVQKQEEFVQKLIHI